MKSKKCITCGKRKAVAKFAVRSDNGKLRGSCRECLNAMAKKNRSNK